MNKKFTRYFFHFTCLLLSLLSWQSCGVDLDAPVPYMGSLRLQRYMAIGDGYTAGFANGGLYAEAQQRAFPRLLAGQLRLLNAERHFRAPLMPGNGSGYYALTGLTTRACDLLGPLPEIQYRTQAANWIANVSGQGPYDNIGVPGLCLRAISQPQYGLQNPYFRRMAMNDSTTLTGLIDQQGEFDFFTLWLGMEDLMPYALSGGTIPPASLIDPEDFRNSYRTLLNHILSREERKGIIGNLPEIWNFPYFTHVPHTTVNLPECINMALSLYVETGVGTVRVAQKEDRILLPVMHQIGLNGFGMSESLPIPDRWVLDADEVNILRQSLNAYNQVLAELVAEAQREYSLRVSLLDMRKYFTYKLIPGQIADGIGVSGKYLSGGLFSLDGYSLTPRGNALIANRFIAEINNYFGIRIPTINISDYPGVEFP